MKFGAGESYSCGTEKRQIPESTQTKAIAGASMTVTRSCHRCRPTLPDIIDYRSGTINTFLTTYSSLTRQN
jgi:hypothetical protein